MNLRLERVFDASAVAAVSTELSGLKFADGARSAGWHAREVKRNEQIRHPALAERVLGALRSHALFQAAALPLRIGTPLFSRYTEGMSYGNHVDNALMPQSGQTLRSDMALTLFLSDPADYEGGELVLELHDGDRRYKLPAGQAVLYPATTLHRVEPVTRGVRLAAVLWVQSFVRDPGQREILFDLDRARRQLWERSGRRTTPEFELVSKSYANLLRRWAQC